MCSIKGRKIRFIAIAALVGALGGCGGDVAMEAQREAMGLQGAFQPVAGTYVAVRTTEHTAPMGALCWALFDPAEITNVTAEGYDEVLPPDDLGFTTYHCALAGRSAYCGPRMSATLDLNPFGFDAVITLKQLNANRREWTSSTSFMSANQAVASCTGDPMVCGEIPRCVSGSTAKYELSQP